MVRPTLLPCPFCGTAPVIEIAPFNRAYRIIRCLGFDCGIRPAAPGVPPERIDEAAAWWNMRPVPPPADSNQERAA